MRPSRHNRQRLSGIDGGGVLVRLPWPVAPSLAPRFSYRAIGQNAKTFSCHRSATHADKRGPSDQWIGETPNNCEHYAQEGVGSSHFCPGGLAKTRSGCTRPCAEHVSLRLVNLLRRQCADHLPPALPYRHSRTALTGDEEREAGVLNPFPVGPGKEGGGFSEVLEVGLALPG